MHSNICEDEGLKFVDKGMCGHYLEIGELNDLLIGYKCRCAVLQHHSG